MSDEKLVGAVQTIRDFIGPYRPAAREARQAVALIASHLFQNKRVDLGAQFAKSVEIAVVCLQDKGDPETALTILSDALDALESSGPVISRSYKSFAGVEARGGISVEFRRWARWHEAMARIERSQAREEADEPNLTESVEALGFVEDGEGHELPTAASEAECDAGLGKALRELKEAKDELEAIRTTGHGARILRERAEMMAERDVMRERAELAETGLHAAEVELGQAYEVVGAIQEAIGVGPGEQDLATAAKAMRTRAERVEVEAAEAHRATGVALADAKAWRDQFREAEEATVKAEARFLEVEQDASTMRRERNEARDVVNVLGMDGLVRRVDELERSNRSLKASAKKARGRYVELRQAVRDSLGATSMSALDSVAAKLRELV